MIPAAKSPPRFATLVSLTALSVLSLNMFLPSLSSMAESFGTDYATISIAVSGYLAVTAVLQLIIGPLSDRYGRRPVMLGALSVFLIASLVCATTDRIEVFLGFRVLQGGIIAGWAVSLAVVRDTFGPQQAASRLGFISMAMAIAPMTGPMIGGVLDEVFGWRANFLLYVGLASVMLLVCWGDLGETNTKKSASLTDQIRSYPSLVRSRRFWAFAGCTAFSTGTFYTFLAGAPLVAEHQFGLSPAVLGICMGSITGGFLFGSFLAGKISARHSLTQMMVAGRLIACAGLAAGLLSVWMGGTDPLLYFGATVFAGLGNGITMPSSNSGVMSINPSLAGSAAGLTGAMTVGTGAALTSLAGAVLTPQNAAVGLLALMLAAGLIALAAAVSTGR